MKRICLLLLAVCLGLNAPAHLEDVRKAREELTGVEYRLFYVPLSINTLER